MTLDQLARVVSKIIRQAMDEDVNEFRLSVDYKDSEQPTLHVFVGQSKGVLVKPAECREALLVEAGKRVKRRNKMTEAGAAAKREKMRDYWRKRREGAAGLAGVLRPTEDTP